jgi:hypothetical protein
MEATPVSEGVKAIVDFINAHPKSTRRQLLDALAPAPPRPTVIPVEAPVEGAEEKKPEPAAPQPTPEQTAIIADLHWLVHQGHVIEFANGLLETAKKPAPRPPKPEPKASEAAGAAPEQEAAASTTAPESGTTAPSEGVVVETPAAETGPVAGAGVEEAAHQPAPPETPQNETPTVAEHDKQSPGEAHETPQESPADRPVDKPVESPS